MASGEATSRSPPALSHRLFRPDEIRPDGADVASRPHGERLRGGVLEIIVERLPALVVADERHAVGVGGSDPGETRRERTGDREARRRVIPGDRVADGEEDAGAPVHGTRLALLE